MKSSDNLRTGGRLLADQLRIQGVDTVFCVPGESYLGLLDGLYDHRDAIRMIAPAMKGRRQHGRRLWQGDRQAGHLRGVARTGRDQRRQRPAYGVSGFSTPLILFIGQVVARRARPRGQQEIDYRDMFRPMAKWVARDRRRRPYSRNMSATPFILAQSGRPGPVVLALPEDMLIDESAAADARPAKAIHPAALGGLQWRNCASGSPRRNVR